MLVTRIAYRACTVGASHIRSRVGRSLALALALAAASFPASAQEVDHRPVVLTGADVPALVGASVTSPVCYAFVEGAWAQCPLQIDERDMLDPASNYPSTVSDANELFGGAPQLLYTAPQDYPMAGFTPVVPVDSDPTFDTDDELVLMARFFGEVVSPQAPPFAPDEVVEVLFDGRAAYVFEPTQPLAQDAGYDFVSYTFDLLSGDFPGTYNFEGDTTLPDEWAEGDYLAANPEYSPVETAYYKTAFEDRWIQRTLSLTDDLGDYGPDILDRVKFGTRPNTMGNNNRCSRSIWTGSARRGTLGIQKDGPIRALRWAQGFNSGGLNYIFYTMYEQFIVYKMAHQMHRSPGASMWFDLAPETSGMLHRSNLFTGTVTVDGSTDRVSDGFVDAYLEWDHFAGSQGSFVSVWDASTNIPNAFPHSYYEDNLTPQVKQCTGDEVAYASSGNVYIFGNNVDDANVPWTDPSSNLSIDSDGNLRFLQLERRIVPDGPNMPDTRADSLVTVLQSPITFSAQNVMVIGEDTLAPTFTGSYDGLAYAGTAFDNQLGDTGLDSLVLGTTSTNLAFSADPFVPGDASVGFTVAPIDLYAPSSGYVVAADTVGNVDSLAVSFTALVPDDAAPVLAGSYSRSQFDGTATDDHIDAAGIASVALGDSPSNLALAVDPFAEGDSPVAFVATPIDALLVASGYIVATDTVGNADSLFVEITPPDPDTTPPVLTGSLNGFAFSGHATERSPDDTGLATVALSADAENVELVADMFTAGADSVGFVVTSLDADLAGTGWIVATDVEGNADSLAVSIAARPADTTAPVVSGMLDGQTYTGSASEQQTDDRGLASVVLSADAFNLSLSTDAFTSGDAVSTFTVAPVDVESNAAGWVVATDVVGNADSVFVEILPPPDTAAPVIAGTASDSSYDGTATDAVTYDSGIASVALSADAVNLSLAVDPFTAGDDVATFSAALVETTDTGTGYVIVSDVAGNADSVLVSLDGIPAFQYDIEATAVASFDTATSGTITVTVSNIGSDTMTDVRVVRQSATGATVDSSPITLGSIDPGLSKEAVYAFSNATAGASASFQAQDLVVRFNEGDTVNNDVTVSLEPLVDVALPVVSGTTNGTTFTGTATDEQADDTGIASITLGSNALNLNLMVDAFTSGDATVGFSATLADPLADASGYVVATDVAGNADSVFVSLVVPDTGQPILTGTYGRSRYDGTATDSQSGVESVTLGDSPTNLALAVDPFAEGDSPVAFVATPIDALLVASGYIVATDTVGNADSLFVEITPPDPDTTPPALAGSLNGFAFDGYATERSADDTGLASVTLSADAANLELVVDPFTAGADSVGFVASSLDIDLTGTGWVIATDVEGNVDSLAVSIAARPADTTAPVLSGTLDAQTYTGSVTERQADDRGLFTIALAADASNLSLSVDAFETGADSVGFVATAVDLDLAAMGYVIATDLMGNVDSLLVDIAARQPDATAPVVSGGLDAQTFAGSATERQADDRGLATVALSVDAVNLTLLVDAFEAGADSVGYSAMSVDPDLA
ncbi:MAG: hypothetical protein AAF624_04330, partial [Bacteroidota bacterium]